MFYHSSEPLILTGAGDYLDITDRLHYFLTADSLSVDITFRTEDPGYPPLLAVYFKESLIPDFSLCLYKGRGALTVRRGGSHRLLVGGEAVCDGRLHTLSFRGTRDRVALWMDGEQIIEDNTPGPWCEFGYVGFATVGRGTRADQYTFFRGEIRSVALSQKYLPPLLAGEGIPGLERTDLFAKGFAGVENYRIPSLLTVGDVTVASADARMEAPGDNPNHICRATRISTDSGKTWEDITLFCDYGGTGRNDGAAAIDGSLLYDRETDTLFQLFSHTSRRIGAFSVQPEDAFDALGRKRLWDIVGGRYYLEAGRVYREDGSETPYTVDAYGRLFRGGQDIGSICHGENRVLRQANVSFLQLIRSEDQGKTWSDPVELNPQVKADWMRFVGAGPGTGLQLREGKHRGRLVFPVYYMNQHKVASSGVIYSDDHGASWHMGRSANDGRILNGGVIGAETVTDPNANLGECQVTELPGGALRIMLRNGYGPHTLNALSDDGGETWHSMQETALPDPQCQSHILRLTHQGREIWLFSNPADSAARVRGTVRASFDGGKTWPIAKLVEPGEFAYSCLTQLPDGQIGVLYEGKEISQRFVKFPLDWLLEE